MANWIKACLRYQLSAYGHITLRIPVPVRSPKSNSVELCQYMDGRPPWNTECCKLFTFVAILIQHSAFSHHLKMHRWQMTGKTRRGRKLSWMIRASYYTCRRRQRNRCAKMCDDEQWWAAVESCYLFWDEIRVGFLWWCVIVGLKAFTVGELVATARNFVWSWHVGNVDDDC